MRTVRRSSAYRLSFSGFFFAILLAVLSICLAPCRAIAAENSADMHRLYNRYTGEHFYTASDAERDGLVARGWTYEGVGWLSAPAATGVPLWRQYNPFEATC